MHMISISLANAGIWHAAFEWVKHPNIGRIATAIKEEESSEKTPRLYAKRNRVNHSE